jgi:Zn-dependent peptidase ImmA (M78 family)
VSFRRGFKTEAERIAAELRGELGLGPLDRLDPFCLAEHLAIPVIPLSHFSRNGSTPSFVKLFLTRETDAFSALTLFNGARRLIVHNDAHAETRQASNITHEISHCILEHAPAPVLSSEGCRYWDTGIEQEADWLAGALLIPRLGALTFTKRGWTAERIALNYCVSEALCRRRIHETGVAIQTARWASAR